MKELVNRLIYEFMDKDYAHAYMDSHQSSRIATQIKVLREQRGLTQKQLAELSKMKQERISALEDVDYDAWTISTLRKLARAFDTTLQISFIPFSQGIQDIADFGSNHLQVESREIDLNNFRKHILSQDMEKIKFDFENNDGMTIFSTIVNKPKKDNANLESVIYRNNSDSAANDNNYQDAA